jgi:lipopolysaccharide transport system permease protein
MIENIKEVLKFRTLLHALVVRHLSMRYRGSVLGFLWSFLNPLCLMLVYTLVFKFYIRFNEVENYTIFLFCGLLPWLWFSSAILEGTSSLVNSGHLITKSMFPAHLLPLVAVLTTLVNFLLSIPLLLFFMVIAGMQLHWTLILVPLVLFLQLLFIHGLVLMLSSLNVYFRDVQHIVANFLTFLFFLCPILYPAKVVPEKFRFTLDLNPVAQFTAFYHNVILDGVLPSMGSLLYCGALVCLSFLIGNLVFNHYRESFAELL